MLNSQKPERETNMNTDFHAAMLIAVMSIVTILLRFLPFIILNGKKTPAYISFLGEVLPSAIIGMLVIYCLRNTDLTHAPFGAPEIIASLAVIILQAVKKNSLVSILCGTLIYMFLVQHVF